VQSPQEIFVKTVLEFGLGAAFLFEPAEFTKGGPGSKQGRGEPADLVWWCRDTAFLFCMQETSRAAERADTHNLKQLRGVARVWEKGRPIVGKNAFRSFHLQATDVDQLALVSVVKAPGATAWVRSEPRTSHNATAPRVLASIPQSVLQRLAEHGGSALDLADFMLRLSSLPGPVSEIDALSFLDEQFLADLARCAEDQTIREDRDENLDREVALAIIEGMRHGPAEVFTHSGSLADRGALATFNDLDWESTRRLVLQTADVIRLVRDVPVGSFGPRAAAIEIDIEPYLFIVGASDARQMTEASDALMPVFERRSAERPDNPPLVMSYQLVGRPQVEFMSALLALPRQNGATMTARALRAIGPTEDEPTLRFPSVHA